MEAEQLRDLVLNSLEELKARDVKDIDVRDKTDVTDIIVIASGTSDTHVKAIADSVIQEAKRAGERPLGVEGETHGEWVLIDLDAVVVHVMLPRVRDYYNLERLWEVDVPAARKAHENH